MTIGTARGYDAPERGTHLYYFFFRFAAAGRPAGLMNFDCTCCFW
jgi:hypothetical protein